MASKNELKLLRNLSRKKFREKHNLFIIEGRKLLEEAVLSQQPVQKILCLEEEMESTTELAPGISVERIDASELSSITSQVNPAGIIAILPIMSSKFEAQELSKQPLLILDGLRDPGNMGTILRTADWFGIHHILCSEDCVDIYNPKVVQSSMGSLFRTKVFTTDLVEGISALKEAKPDYQIACAALDGESIHIEKALNADALVIGSESHGVSSEVISACDRSIRIPGGEGVESLNASVAASILMYQWLSPRS